MRRIDADALKHHLEAKVGDCKYKTININDVIAYIDGSPTVKDKEELIVKLSDDRDIIVKNGEYIKDLVRCGKCKKKHICIMFEGFCDDDAFCSNGEIS